MTKKPNAFGLVLVAAMAGAVAGLLFAPKRGTETREELKDKYNEMKNKTQDKALDAKDKLNKGIDAARGKAHDVADKTKDVADDAAARAKEATTTLSDEIQAEHAKRNRPTL